jgi:hypothetical protein
VGIDLNWGSTAKFLPKDSKEKEAIVKPNPKRASCGRVHEVKTAD